MSGVSKPDSVDRIVRVVLQAIRVLGAMLLLGAAGMATSVVGYVRDGLRMSNWQEVPATVLKAEYREKAGDKHPHFFAEYRYRYGDVDYLGTRVDIGDPYLTLLERESEEAKELMRHLRDGSPIAAFVNPAQPDEGVLYRRFSYEFLSILAGMTAALAIGGGLFFVPATISLRRKKAEARLREVHPDEPWLWRDDWAAKRIRSTSIVDTRLFTIVAALYLLGVLPLGLLVVRERNLSVWSVPGVVLIVIGLALFRLARQKRKKARTLDAAEFRPAEVPGLVGGPLAGVVAIPGSPSLGEGPFRVRLECTQKGDADSSGPTVLWRDKTTIQRPLATADPTTIALPIYFAIPYDCRPVDPNEPGRRWLLRVGPEQGYADDDAEFDVPVFRTAASSPNYVPDPMLLAPYETSVDRDKAIAAAGGRIRLLDDGRQEWRFSLFRRSIFCGGLAMAAACWVAVAAVWQFQWHWGWAVVPALFGVLILLGLSEMLFWASRLLFGADAVEVTAGYWPLRTIGTLTAEEIAGVETAVEWTRESHDMYCVKLISREGEKFGETVLAKRMDNRRTADAVCEALREKMPKARRGI
jgi:hypothetical protein